MKTIRKVASLSVICFFIFMAIGSNDSSTHSTSGDDSDTTSVYQCPDTYVPEPEIEIDADSEMMELSESEPTIMIEEDDEESDEMTEDNEYEDEEDEEDEEEADNMPEIELEEDSIL